MNYWKALRLSFFCWLLVCAQAFGQAKSVPERLGYPANTKLLIVHGDDLAVAHSVDTASFDALEKGAITSASIMVPCPWLTEVADYAHSHPEADLGLHLTLTSEWKSYRWGPVASSNQVTTLLNPSGMFWDTTPAVAAHAKPDEAEREIRAQLERALAWGIHPTHLDTHMGSVRATPEIFDAYVKVAHDYHLPFLALKAAAPNPRLSSAISDKDILLDAVVIAAAGLPASEWKNFYRNAISSLKPGLTEMIVHLGHDDAELEAVMGISNDYGAAWRQRDYDFVTGWDFKKALEENHVVLVKWKDLEKVLDQR
ncbi:MAG: polysaccharide deacetylase family protein [Acidobacteria bacterium]|nr:polysaccharide deacetylase family protein [Acidobacteriota bacterium]MBV9182096.1 polysaccharide deacetylase family protein [Acidobacteriota bacterium]